LWLANAALVLASRSTIRRTLLDAAGVSVEVCPADIDERALEAQVPHQSPTAVAALLACEKAMVISRRSAGRLVLGADQTLSLDDHCFAKPSDRAAARMQLRALSGRAHELHSAIAFVQDGAVLFEAASIARLTVRPLSDGFIDRYLDAAGQAATASVGAYQLEGLGAQLFEHIDGDYFTVLGLPLLPALGFLRRHGCLRQ
jgi:septum formation protein